LNPILFTMKLQIDRYSFIGNENGRLSHNQGRTDHCGNAANALRGFFLRMRGILKISENLRLF
jgi:hypothetical protein